MIPTALYDNPQEIIDENYNIDKKWAKHFPELAILLPDTFGTTYYQKNAPKRSKIENDWFSGPDRDHLQWLLHVRT